jgi:RES domain-containing protein
VALRRFGPLVAFRIADDRFPLLDGGGAFQAAGRWHRPGRSIIYAGLGFAGTMLEKLVRLRTGRMPARQQYAEIFIPGPIEIEQIGPADVPGWERADRTASQAYGDAWYDSGRTAVLIVPSLAAMGLEHNVLINQRHPQFRHVTHAESRPVVWDARLFASR